MNIVELYDYIKEVCDTIPLINSYYNESVYDCWNNKEVKYGSLVFVVKSVRNNNNTFIYDCVVYYGDRILEDRSNVADVQSDAVNVIKSVLGVLNNTNEEVNVTYPFTTTLFEQKFVDELAGGYADVSIATYGIGECGY